MPELLAPRSQPQAPGPQPPQALRPANFAKRLNS